MISKHIYLTEELDRQVHLVALTEKKPEAQVIRDVLHAGFATLRPGRTGGDALLALARFAEESGVKGPPDLSRNIDTYLYDNP